VAALEVDDIAALVPVRDMAPEAVTVYVLDGVKDIVVAVAVILLEVTDQGRVEEPQVKPDTFSMTADAAVST